MSTILQEGDVTLELDSSWEVAIKWDDTRAYRDGLQRLSGSRAVDICGVRDKSLISAELKDFRGARIENKPRLDGSALYEEVATKVRDTLAGILGAARTRQTEGGYRALAEAAVAHERPLRVLLWLEEDRRPRAAELSARTNKLKQTLRWLTARVQVEDLDGTTARALGVTVRRHRRSPR